jgi:hypothetical protein
VPIPSSPTPAGQQASFAALLTETVDGVVQAQRRLDTDALARTTQFISTPQGEIALPPLWFTFSTVNLQLELTASVTRITPARTDQQGENGKRGSVRLDCRLVNPAAVSLFGYTAASGFKVSLTLAPQHASPLLSPGAPDLPTPSRVTG